MSKKQQFAAIHAATAPAVEALVNPAHEVPVDPDPARTVMALRSLGYDPVNAVGDLIDNGAEAGATVVLINIVSSGDHRRIEIIDNGSGVPPELREEVFRLGAKVSHAYSEASWSVYGMGLKTASWSMGRRITMLTKTINDQAIAVLVMDIDRIINGGKWIVEFREPTAEEQTRFAADVGEHGTIVIIDSLDRLSQHEMKHVASRLPFFIGRTYSKVLRDPKNPAKGSIEIKVDGESVAPHDPLHRSDPDVTQLLPRTAITLTDNHGKDISIWLSATHLPHPDLLVERDPDRRKRYRYTLANQGIYVFREQRLILAGETLGVFSKDFHFNSFRAELEFGEDADELFALKIDKGHIVLPQVATDKISKILKPAINSSNAMWRAARMTPAASETELHDTSSNLIKAKERALPALPSGVRSAKSATKQGRTNGKQPGGKGEQKQVAVVVPVSDLPGDVLWEPVFEDGRVQVRLNTSHPYYRVLYPTLRDLAEKEPEVFRLVDQLFYALGRAELMSAGEDDAPVLLEYRLFASSALRIMLDR